MAPKTPGRLQSAKNYWALGRTGRQVKINVKAARQRFYVEIVQARRAPRRPSSLRERNG